MTNNCDFIEDFDLDPETTLKYHMWAASSSIEGGMSESDVLLIYQITFEELRKYYEENPNSVTPTDKGTQITDKGKLYGEYVDPFEHTPDFALTIRIWNVDEAYRLGMDEESVVQLYNITKQQVKEYYEQFPHTRILRHHK